MIAYYTTTWTPYHETICRELASRLGGDFKLVLTRPIDSSRNLGWDLRPPVESWIICPPDSHDQVDSGVWPRLIKKAEIVVLGALYEHRALFRAVDERVLSGKLTFFMAERPFKRGLKFHDFLRPYNWYVWWRLHRRYNHRNVHFLAIGNGVREDLGFLRVRKATIHSWAYFPAVSPGPTIKPRSPYLRICWCGRMIACKHVEVLLQAVARLPSEVLSRCRVTIAGDGVMRDQWIALAKELHLENAVSFLPMLSHGKVLSLMADSDVYVFPSDGEEGWGVALGEAMDKCCVPVACASAGASQTLIANGENGFCFDVGDIDKVAECLVYLDCHREDLERLGVCAWASVQQWSAERGADKLVKLFKES